MAPDKACRTPESAAPKVGFVSLGCPRNAADAPEIDGVVHVKPSPALKTGWFATVRVTRSDQHDLWAEIA